MFAHYRLIFLKTKPLPFVLFIWIRQSELNEKSENKIDKKCKLITISTIQISANTRGLS